MIKLNRWQQASRRCYKEPEWDFFDFDLTKKKGKWKLRRYGRETLMRRVEALKDLIDGQFRIEYELDWASGEYIDNMVRNNHQIFLGIGKYGGMK